MESPLKTVGINADVGLRRRCDGPRIEAEEAFERAEPTPEGGLKSIETVDGTTCQ